VAQTAALVGGEREWITVLEAASRVGISPSWFRAVAKVEGIEIRRRSRKPGVNWVSVARWIESSKFRTR